ncbi:MAG: hypothetical protein ACKOYK_11960 [Cyanobium sp.]
MSQIKELVALTVLGLLSSMSASLLLKEATSGFMSQHGNPLIRAYFDFARLTHHPLNGLIVFLAPAIWLLALLTHYRIPRLVLDCFGVYFVFRMVIGLIFVNALLFVPAASPSLLLGQILAFLPFFVRDGGRICRIKAAHRSVIRIIDRIQGLRIGRSAAAIQADPVRP